MIIKIQQITALLTTMLTLTLAGCTNLLEGSVESIVPHESTPYERPPVEQITISSLGEFSPLLLELIMDYEEETTVQYLGAEHDDIQAQLISIADELKKNHPVAAYAVTDITVTAARIVAYVEVDILIEFRRTHEQLQGIINASTQRYMMTQLLEKMGQYEPEAVFLTNLVLEREEIIAQVGELYYQNPRRIVMKPYITVTVYPQSALLQYFTDTQPDQPGSGEDSGDGGPQEPQEPPDLIYEIRFGYTENTEMLHTIGENLYASVRQNAARADGETDGEILLSLTANLAASTHYDEGTAGTIAMHGPQNIAATAFGALVRGNAVGEGFAMAFKALCDELRLDCRVVLGQMGDRFHAWNIVLLDGFYYHIDTAMCSSGGLEAGFLKNDGDMLELYTWDTGNMPECNGPLTLTDLLPPELSEDEQDGEDDEDGEDGEDGEPGSTPVPADNTPVPAESTPVPADNTPDPANTPIPPDNTADSDNTEEITANEP